MVSELFRAFHSFLEVFRGFSKALSETLSEPIFLSELRAVLPLIVLPFKTPTTTFRVFGAQGNSIGPIRDSKVTFGLPVKVT